MHSDFTVVGPIIHILLKFSKLNDKKDILLKNKNTIAQFLRTEGIYKMENSCTWIQNKSLFNIFFKKIE